MCPVPVPFFPVVVANDRLKVDDISCGVEVGSIDERVPTQKLLIICLSVISKKLL